MLFSKSRLGDPAKPSCQQVHTLCNTRTLTNAVSEPFVEIVSRPDIHLADLVLGVATLLLQCVLRLAVLLHQLLHFVEFFHQKSGT
jgi:hypothetical protein